MRPVPPQRALQFVAKRSLGRERLNRESERPLDPDLVAAFSREQLPAPSAPGGRSSGKPATEPGTPLSIGAWPLAPIRATSTARIWWPRLSGSGSVAADVNVAPLVLAAEQRLANLDFRCVYSTLLRGGRGQAGGKLKLSSRPSHHGMVVVRLW
jgi:hypothetical protein